MENNQALGIEITRQLSSQAHDLSVERRREIEAAYVRKDVDALRQSFASNNDAVSEYAERFLEKALEEIRSERDRKDALLLKTKLSRPLELGSTCHFWQF